MDDPSSSTAEGSAFDFHLLMRVVLERFSVILGMVILMLVLALGYILKTPRIYESSAVIQVEQKSQSVVEDQGEEDLRSQDILKTYEQNLRSRTLALRVAQRVEIRDNPAIFPPRLMGGEYGENQQAGRIAPLIEVELQRGTRLITITASATDAETARQLATAVVEEFMLESVRSRSGSTQVTHQFLVDEAGKLKLKLAQTEQAQLRYQKFLNLSTNIVARESEITNMQQRYKEKHPMMIQSRRVLEDLRRAYVDEAVRMDRLESMTAPTKKEPVTAQLPGDLSEDEKFNMIRNKMESQLNVLTRDVETDRAMYESILTRLKETGVSQGVGADTTLRVMEKPFAPDWAAKPKKLMILGLAVAVGGFLGLVLAFFLNSLDSSLRTVDEVEKYLGLPVLGAIPEIGAGDRQTGKAAEKWVSALRQAGTATVEAAQLASRRGKTKSRRKWKNVLTLGFGPLLSQWRRSSRSLLHGLPVAEQELDEKTAGELVVLEDSNSIAAEAFRSLRAQIKLLGDETAKRTILFTSAVPSEGKSFTASNYAVTLAMQGFKTILIDVDLRRPMVHKIFGLEKASKGIVDYLVSREPLDNFVVPTGVENLSLLIEGSRSPNPAELLSGKRFEELIQEATQKYDRVVVDSAPVHAVSDTLMLVKTMDWICLVMRAAKTPRAAVARASHLLEKSGRRPVGAVLNRLPRFSGVGYYNPYHYYYSYGQSYGESYGAAPRK